MQLLHTYITDVYPNIYGTDVQCDVWHGVSQCAGLAGIFATQAEATAAAEDLWQRCDHMGELAVPIMVHQRRQPPSLLCMSVL